MYTVFENESSVEVCAILSEPQIDILDEEVVVYVINFPSTYIPLGAVIASE